MDLSPSATPTPGSFADPLYARISALIYREAGIVLGPEKVGLIDSRLNRRVTATGSRDLADYINRYDNGAIPDERSHLVSALTTNFTNFYREPHHFDFLREVILRDAMPARPTRIWSAGCSSGQEPYSIAMCARQAGRPVEITATDIDQDILERAQTARFKDYEVSGIDPDLMQISMSRQDDEWEVRPALRDMIRFSQLNLHAPWPFSHAFDAIFCRNVIIYFDADSQIRLWERFCRQLRPGGWLLIGHSERIPDHMRDRLKPVRHTVYQYDPV